VSLFYVIFFLLFLIIFLQSDENWGWKGLFHSSLMSWFYYIFLMATSIQFDFLDSNKTFSQPTIKKNIRIMVGLVSAWVSTDTYFMYL
jgi:presenilin-like A22 family membrane protease